MKPVRIVLGTLLLLSLAHAATAAPRKAPGFALLNADNRLVTLSGLTRKGALILSFWATYCVPCKREMPEVARLARAYGERKNVGLLFVSIDREGTRVAKPFLDGLGITSPCVFDIYQETAKRYIPSLTVPALFLINENGMIVFEAGGDKPETLTRLEEAIRRLPDRPW